MFVWIESRPTPIIAFLVLGICYALAVMVFIAASVASHRPIARDLQKTAPSMLSPLGGVLALIIAFLAARVWANLDHANTYTGQEASAINECVVIASRLPGNLPLAIRGSVKKYIQFVIDEDQPAMREGQASLELVPPGLTEAMGLILSFAPTDAGQRIAQERTEVAIERVLEARRNRIVLSQSTIEPIQWTVILILTTLILATIAMVHLESRVAVAVNLFIFATAVAVSLTMLMANDRPFAAGGYDIDLSSLREVIPAN